MLWSSKRTYLFLLHQKLVLRSYFSLHECFSKRFLHYLLLGPCLPESIFVDGRYRLAVGEQHKQGVTELKEEVSWLQVLPGLQSGHEG